MLNPQGRVICDILLYRTPNTRYDCKFSQPGEASEDDELMIECDASLASGLANTLYAYRVRRKVALEILPDQQVWCLYPNLGDAGISSSARDQGVKELLNLEAFRREELLSADMTIVNDPRVDSMGLRILAKTTSDIDQIKAALGGHNVIQTNVKDYTIHRYNLGIGEGPDDHPEGNCLPLECNADLMGSVSFNKGCYLGQELTARIHFTGVVRKRLMPCLLDVEKGDRLNLPLLPGSDIVDADGKKLGSLRHVMRNHALSLLRQDIITPQTKLSLEATGVALTTWRPYWWNIG